MRILMTTDTVGGVWTYSLQLIGALAVHDVHVDLATMGGEITDAQREAALALPNLTLHPSSYALEWMPDPWAEVDRAGDWLLGLERRTRPDVVHLNGYAHGNLPFRAPTLVAGHSCVCSWWRAVKREEAPAEWDTYRDRVTAGLRAAKHIIAPSNAMLASLERDYGPFASAEAIYNARSPLKFRPAMKHQMIFSAGRLWDEAKNVAALDAVAQRLPWPVYVAGESRHPARAEIAASPHVSFLGKLTERQVAARAGYASIYALPARYEPFGLSILEAALAGCALVLGDIDSLREIWQDTALFVDPNDHEALADALLRLIQSPRDRALYAARSQLRAHEFTPERMAQAYVRTYARLVAHGGAASSVAAMPPAAIAKSIKRR